MNIVTNFFALHLFILGSKLIQAFNYCPQYDTRCECANTFTLKCENFDLLDELLNFTMSTGLTIAEIYIRPRQPIVFDYSSRFNLFDNLKLRQRAAISLSNFLGINIDKNPFENLRLNNSQTIQLVLQFNDTILNFYTNNKTIDETDCSNPNLNTNLSSIFLPFDSLVFYDTVTYPSSLCAKVFASPFLSELFFYNFNNLNNFLFYSTDLTQNFNGLRVEKLYFINSQINQLSSSILYPSLFRKILSLNFFNVFLTSIEENLLASFKDLRSITFDINNFRDFTYNLNWLKDLNPDFANVTPTDADMYKTFQVEILLGDRQMSYEFSDENFCLFKDFPHRKLVYPALSTRENLACSCTVMWLIQYYKYYQLKERLETKSIANCINDTQIFEKTIRDCNLEQRVNTCNLFENSKQGTLRDWELALIISLPSAFVLILAIVFIIIFCRYKRKKPSLRNNKKRSEYQENNADWPDQNYLNREQITSSGTEIFTTIKKYTTFNGMREIDECYI